MTVNTIDPLGDIELLLGEVKSCVAKTNAGDPARKRRPGFRPAN